VPLSQYNTVFLPLCITFYLWCCWNKRCI